MEQSEIFTPQLTADGSFTFFSAQFDESFHSIYGAKQEAQHKFIEPCQLEEKAKNKSSLKILDICYGLGYNSAAALAAIWTINPECSVELIALELDSKVPLQAITHNLIEQWGEPIPQLCRELANTHLIQSKKLKAELLIGDGRQTIQKVYQSGWQADAIFLDPFSPPKCPQLWTVEFIALVAQCLNPTGRLATYSCAASVRTALLLADLNIGATKSVGRRSPGTIASFTTNTLLPLSQQEKEHLQTRAAIPYRDPQLQNSAPIITQKRQKEQQNSSLEPSSHWKKRWSTPA